MQRNNFTFFHQPNDEPTPYNPQDRLQSSQIDMLANTAFGMFRPLEDRLKLLNARYLSKDMDQSGFPQDRRNLA